MKGEAGGDGHRNRHWETNERLWRETNEGRQQRQPTAAQNRDHEGRQLKGDKAAAKSSPIIKRDYMKGDKAAAAAKSRPEWRSWRETKWRETRRHQQPRAGQNGDHQEKLNEGRQGGSGSQWRSGRGTNEERQGGSGITTMAIVGSATQSLRSKNPYSFQLSGEWRETNEGRVQEQARMEIMKGD